MTFMVSGVGEGDFELHRYGDGRIGVNWQEDLGGYYAPKDYTGWACKLTLEDEFGDVLYETACSTSMTGDVWGDIPASAISDQMVRSRGRWRIVGTCGNRTELIGHGNYRIC